MFLIVQSKCHPHIASLRDQGFSAYFSEVHFNSMLFRKARSQVLFVCLFVFNLEELEAFLERGSTAFSKVSEDL